MKRNGTEGKIAAFALVFAAAACFAASNDPMVASEEIAGHLTRRIAEDGAIKVAALVVGDAEEGVALVDDGTPAHKLVRKGSVIRAKIDGISVEAKVKSVTASGVEIAADKKSVFLSGRYTPLEKPQSPVKNLVRYMEAESVKLGDLMKLVSDRTGVNISSSDAAAGKPVSVFLRNITVAAAVEEVCRTTGLWFRGDGEIIRIMTMEEYAKNLASFREESMETFTLLYPNVVEVAGVIYGLYPDRTLLSLGEQEVQEDGENDLSRRFRRFRVLEDNGGSQFMDMEAPTVSGSSGNTGSGTFSFSRGSALSRVSQWDQLRNRRRLRTDPAGAGISQAEAKRLEEAVAAGDREGFERLLNESRAAANIFVSISRKNNMLIVRTSDTKAMGEIRELVKSLDVPTPMVLLEVKVMELLLDDDYAAGFQWGLTDIVKSTQESFSIDGNGNEIYTGSVSSERIPGISSSSIGHTTSTSESGTFVNDKLISGTRSTARNANLFADAAQAGMNSFTPTFAFQVLSDKIATSIRLMQKDGKVKVLATPTLLTANNEVSRIFNGKEYPIITGWSASGTVSNQSTLERYNAVPEIERKDVGTMLLVTPNINADRTVTIHLLQENSELAGKASIPVTSSSSASGSADDATLNLDIDYIESRSLTGTFVAKDKMTVLAGGLIKESEEETYYRTPFFGSIPLLGWLFRGTEKSKVRTELIVLITPHVISTPYEGGKISDELLKALSAHPARDGSKSLGTLRKGKDGPAAEHTVTNDLINIFK